MPGMKRYGMFAAMWLVVNALPTAAHRPAAADLNQEAAALKKRGQIEQAVVLYQKAIGLNPRYHESYYNLGQIFYEQKHDEKQALLYFQKCVKVYPRCAQAWHQIGLCLKHANDLDGAEHALETSCNIEPTFSRLYNWADVLTKQKKLEKARTVLQQAKALPMAQTTPKQREKLQAKLDWIDKNSK